MKNFGKHWNEIFAVALFAAFLFMLNAGTPAWAQGEIKSEFGNWNLHCETPVGAKDEHCTLIQRVVSENHKNIRMQLILLRTSDNASYIMRVLVPLGVILPPGLGLSVDDREVGQVGFVRCILDGCVAEVILPLALINVLSKGETATFTIYQTPEEGISVPVSLEGFTEGFNALK